MVPVPIGILTRDRVAYLDTTLRSLSAATLPKGQSVTVYDDGSVTAAAKAYYSTDAEVRISHKWPASHAWNLCGLGIINAGYTRPVGIASKLRVVRFPRSMGVLAASCLAIVDMFNASNAPGVLLIQDDVVFNADFYSRLVAEAQATPQIGVMAGIHINKVFRPRPQPGRLASGITAQCLYISREAFDARHAWFSYAHTSRKQFDDSLRREVAAAGLWAGCIIPFVCQHTGVTSLVRPSRQWNSRPRGRVGYYGHPPYVLAAEVKCFGGASP